MFAEKVVLVTGAVRNTGLAIAEAFAEAGATVALNGRKESDVAREAVRLRSTYGTDVIEVPADVSDQAAVERMFETIRNECGRLDVLVNNAVLQGVGYPLEETPTELLHDVFSVNVFGTYYCCQHAARMMTAQQSCAIVNVGSNTSLRAIRNRTAYVASKGAVDALTRAMAAELGPQGIRVNSAVAGYINTDRWDTLDDDVAERRRKNIPLGKEASGADIARSVLFLASDTANGINGINLVVDGGTSCQLVPADCDS